MRAIKSLADVQIVLKQLLDWQNTKDTQNWDMKGKRIINAGNGVDPTDYVTVQQLQKAQAPAATSNAYFSIPFSSQGVVSVGDLIPPYNPGQGRSGKPYQILLDAVVPPSSAPLTMNLQINGVSILVTPISLPVAATGAVVASNFITALPMVSFMSRIVPIVVTTDGTTAGVTMTLVVQKQ